MRHSRIKALIWLGMTVTACGRGTDSAPRRESTGEGKMHSGAAQRPTGAALRPDSTTIVVAGPTLIVFFKGAYTASDSGGDYAEALSDLEYHLGSARPALDSLGVTVEERYGDVINYVMDAVTHSFTPAPDSGRIAYLFVAPGGSARVHYRLLTDIELTNEVRTTFRLTQRRGPNHGIER
jgi:hypothetical protein